MRDTRPALPALSLLGAALLFGACTPLEPQTSAEVERMEQLLTQCQAEAGEQRTAQQEALQQQLAELRGEVDKLGERFQVCEKPPAPPVAAPPPPVKRAPAPVVASKEPEKLVVGRKENVWIEDLQLALPARIDTGAETASLDARNIAPFERDGKAWVRFDIQRPKSEEMITLERPLEREALVLQSNSEEPERRPVIKLGIQIGTIRQLAEFTLSDRGHLDYQMLVGRNILRDVMLVDVSKINMIKTPKKPAASNE